MSDYLKEQNCDGHLQCLFVQDHFCIACAAVGMCLKKTLNISDILVYYISSIVELSNVCV